MIKLTIPIQPITKKNSMVRTAHGMIQSKQYREYEKEAVLFLPALHIEKPVTVCMGFYMRTHGIVDLSNLEAACLDVLVKAGTLKDDNSKIVVSMDGSRVLYDKQNPRTVVYISDYEGGLYDKR